MRLLERLPNAEPILRQFNENDAPAYAILSHTWEASGEEVSFQDMMAGTGKNKAGYRKIEFCAVQAAADGIQYFWIDTCCIDKTDSSELSEALNSMYRWYQRAEVCYSYLSDVPTVGFAQSRWFLRAWTLQELLAPKEMVFYAANWNALGTRNDLSVTISQVTGIEQGYLSHADLFTASVAKRMAWAGKRNATRPEDVAYSLFGIFDVQMPLLYGEGQYKAFQRLQEEIMKSSSDHTLLAWGVDGSSPDYLGVLAQSPADFLGSHDLVPVIDEEPETPYSMTNIGLRINLPVNRKRGPNLLRALSGSDPQKEILGRLRCRKEHDFFNRVAIHLKPLYSNQYVRQPGNGIIFMGDEEMAWEQDIYIKTNPPSKSVKESERLDAFIIRTIAPTVKLLDVYPPGSWNRASKIIQGQTPNEKTHPWHACLLVEVLSPNAPSYRVVVVLGLNSPKKGDCKPFGLIQEGLKEATLAQRHANVLAWLEGERQSRKPNWIGITADLLLKTPKTKKSAMEIITLSYCFPDRYNSTASLKIPDGLSVKIRYDMVYGELMLVVDFFIS